MKKLLTSTKLMKHYGSQYLDLRSLRNAFPLIVRRSIISLGILIVIANGCSLLHHPSAKKFSQSPSIPSIEAKIIQESPLLRGGKLLIVPFNPGEQVVASREFEKVSLMMVKGIAQVIQQSPSGFTVLMADNANQADVVLKGHVDTMENRSSWKKWMTKTQTKVMTAEGKLVDRVTGQELLSFRHVKNAPASGTTWDDVALALGEDIGNFILTLNSRR